MTDDVANDPSQAPSSPALDKYFDYTFTRFVRIIEVLSSFSDMPLGQVHIILLACICYIWHGRRERKGGKTCSVCLKFFISFFTLCVIRDHQRDQNLTSRRWLLLMKVH